MRYSSFSAKRGICGSKWYHIRMWAASTANGLLFLFPAWVIILNNCYIKTTLGIILEIKVRTVLYQTFFPTIQNENVKIGYLSITQNHFILFQIYKYVSYPNFEFYLIVYLYTKSGNWEHYGKIPKIALTHQNRFLVVQKNMQSLEC